MQSVLELAPSLHGQPFLSLHFVSQVCNFFAQHSIVSFRLEHLLLCVLVLCLDFLLLGGFDAEHLGQQFRVLPDAHNVLLQLPLELYCVFQFGKVD